MQIHQCEMYPDGQTWDVTYNAIDDGKTHPWPAMRFHLESQDTSLPGWNELLQLVEDAARDKRETFSPRKELGREHWNQVVTLPASISTLKYVRKLDLYRSNLLRIPPEIGEMESLMEFVPYTSYGLHWFPYEITKCKHLQSSTVSTRALYGNYKYRQPFPSLEPVVAELVSTHCSLCSAPIELSTVKQVWLSLRVATDVLPLLVNACSSECVGRLPSPAKNYVQVPHSGGLSVQQPLPYAGPQPRC